MFRAGTPEFVPSVSRTSELVVQFAERLGAAEKSLENLTVALMERDCDVDRDMLTLEQRLNRHRTEIDRADDHVSLLQ